MYCFFFLFDCENISFDVSLVLYIFSTNNPPIMIINMIYETQNLLSLSLFPSWSGLGLISTLHNYISYTVLLPTVFMFQVSQPYNFNAG